MTIKHSICEQPDLQGLFHTCCCVPGQGFDPSYGSGGGWHSAVLALSGSIDGSQDVTPTCSVNNESLIFELSVCGAAAESHCQCCRVGWRTWQVPGQVGLMGRFTGKVLQKSKYLKLACRKCLWKDEFCASLKGCVHVWRQRVKEKSVFRGPCWVTRYRFVGCSFKNVGFSSCDVVVHFFPSGVLGGPRSSEALVWQQRRLHSCCAGRTFDFRHVFSLSELKTFYL